jgi:dolichol kinase
VETFLLALGLSAGYLAVVLAIEILKRKRKVSPELTRRLIHIFSGVYTVLDYYLLPSVWFIALITISLIVMIVSQRLGWFSSIHDVRRKTYGEIFLPLGTLLTYAISQGRPEIFVPSIFIMTFADSFAGLTSDLLKKERKVFQGSVVFFVIAFLLLVENTHLPLGHTLLATIVVTLVERFSPLGSDNATVPMATALLLLTL